MESLDLNADLDVNIQCHSREKMLNPSQRVILSIIREYSKTAKKPVDIITLKKILVDQMVNSTLETNLRELIKMGYLRRGVSSKRSFILIKWE